MSPKLCTLCGIRIASTKEHVPPKAIFPKPRPSNLITVPACFECNNLSSQLDESFMVHLGMHVGSEDTVGGRVLEERAIPTLRHNSRLRNWVLSNMKPGKLLSDSGETLTEVQIGLWDSEAHSAVIEKCIRGLFFHHYGEILKIGSCVKTHYFNSLTPEIISMSKNWPSNTIGNDDFVYKYTSASNKDTHMSVWLFQFFGSHWAGGQTKTQLRDPNA